jgi:hypothetical protein
MVSHHSWSAALALQLHICNGTRDLVAPDCQGIQPVGVESDPPTDMGRMRNRPKVTQKVDRYDRPHQSY